MTAKKKKKCIACEVQECIGSAPHEHGCRCYGIAFLMGIAQAAFMAQKGEPAVLCDACLIAIRRWLCPWCSTLRVPKSKP